MRQLKERKFGVESRATGGKDVLIWRSGNRISSPQLDVPEVEKG